MLLAVTASAQDVSFSDNFYTTRWSKGEHMLGCSYLDPTNVGVGGGSLRIQLPARTLEGGEILTNELHGSYSADIKVPNAPGSITGFFLYKAPDYESEIDVEVYNDSTRRVILSTYAGGQPIKTWNDGIPQTSMHLMLNTWFPSWLNGKRLKKSAYTYVDRIDFVARRL